MFRLFNTAASGVFLGMGIKVGFDLVNYAKGHMFQAYYNRFVAPKDGDDQPTWG